MAAPADKLNVNTFNAVELHPEDPPTYLAYGVGEAKLVLKLFRILCVITPY